MKIAFTLLTLVVASQCFADRFVDILPLQLQFRYEDSANQAIEVIQYRTLGVAIQPGAYRLGFEYSRNENETGNSSLSVRTDIKEYTVNASYRVLEFVDAEKRQSLGFLLGAVAGTTQTQVNSQVVGSTSTSKSGQNIVYGVSVSVIGAAATF